MHRTFQEYYAALYLLRKPPEELKQFVIEKHNIAAWYEPLLLAIAYKSIQGSQEERRQASDLIEAIANATDDYESVLQRSLLFAANCMVDCSAWSINTSLQQGIAYRLFELYGDSSGACRYTQLQQDIEKVALLWLRGQPQGGTQQNAMPPLLTAWREALVNNDAPNPLRQEGPVHLLASIAPNLASCPKSVLHALVPPLLQIAGVQDWYRQELSCPPEIRALLFQTTARPCSLRVEDYAFVVLRLLDSAGPAGWLHADWRDWRDWRDMPKLPDLRKMPNLQGWQFIRDLRYLLDLLDQDQVVGILCNILKQQADKLSSTALFALWSVLSPYDTIPPTIAEQVHDSIEVYQRQRQPLPIDERQLVEVISRRIGESSTPVSEQPEPAVTRETPDERATRLDALKQRDQLSKSNVEEILAACIDTRELSKGKWKELLHLKEVHSAGTVGQIAWRLLSQPFSIEAEALSALAQALDDDTVVCAAALLLQHCKKIPQDLREDTARRIMNILADDKLSHRPLDPSSEYSGIWRLDDVLFETLKVLAE